MSLVKSIWQEVILSIDQFNPFIFIGITNTFALIVDCVWMWGGGGVYLTKGTEMVGL